MTLVDTHTGELIDALTEHEAERISNRISLRLDTIADNYDAVLPLIREAIQRQAWLALGFASPGAYAAERFGGALSRLGAEFRQDVSRELAALGMSSRAIAPVVGVSDRMVRKDIAGGNPVPTSQALAPESVGEADEGAGQTDAGGRPEMAVTPAVSTKPEGESVPAKTSAEVAPRPPVTGLDGKSYSRPTPSPKPVLDGDAAEYANAEKASMALSRAISKLLEFQHPNMREGMRRYWSMASQEVPPTPRRDVTPEQMREAAHGLLALADEWGTP